MQQYLQNKKGLVKKVFNKVYNKYDLMNDLMSFGVHRIWKRDLIQFMNPSKNKRLIDVACGTGDLGKIYLDIVGSNEKILCVDSNKKMISEAITQYHVIDKNNNYTLLKLNPTTGRKHQLRKQLFAMGHPIFGDQKYKNIHFLFIV